MQRSTMTSRERVLAAIKGQPVDQVPVMYWLNPHMTCRLLTEYQAGRSRIASLVARYLWKRFVRCGGPKAGEWTRAFPFLFEEYGNGSYVLDLGADVSIQSPELSSATSFMSSIKRKNGQIRIAGPFGIVYGLGGIYADVIDHPIKKIQDLKNIQFPPLIDKQFAAVKKYRETHPEVCLLVEAFSFQQVVRDFLLETSQYLLALYDHPDEIHEFHCRLADWLVEIIKHVVKAGADIVFLQDDYGTTGRPFISMEMWKEFTYPHLKRFVETAHDAGVPFMLHSCGYQMPFLEYYVEAGVDALQSFQPKAENDFETAYERYGDRLAFATGIDIQRGESMSPQELRQEILQNYRIGQTKGRHILCTTHMMQYTMPIENVHTIFETVREIQAGMHD